MRIRLFYNCFVIIRIFNAEHLSVLAITDLYLLKRCLPFYFWDLIVLLAWSLYSSPHFQTQNTFLIVSDNLNYFSLLLFFPKAILLFCCLYYSYLTRNIRNDYNESDPIFKSIWHLGIATLTIFIIAYNLYDRIRFVDLLFGASCSFLFVCFVSYMFLFMPKFSLIYNPVEVRNSSVTNVKRIHISRLSSDPTRTASSSIKSESVTSLRSLCESSESFYKKKKELFDSFMLETQSLLQAIVTYQSRLMLLRYNAQNKVVNSVVGVSSSVPAV